MVHVQEFLQQTQNQKGGVPNFLTRLRGVAAPFEFRERCQDCAWDVSYSDTIVWFKLIAGLNDAGIKEHILSLEEKSLDHSVKAIKARESGKQARQILGTLAGPAKIASTSPDSPRCGHCGRVSHTSQREDRERNCPAWDKACLSCERKGQFKCVCKTKKCYQRENRRKLVTKRRTESDVTVPQKVGNGTQDTKGRTQNAAPEVEPTLWRSTRVRI